MFIKLTTIRSALKCQIATPVPTQQQGSAAATLDADKQGYHIFSMQYR
jgi:hypothetical protein